ncbi:MBL fold metallo-hydrolase [bacterium]|nr:MAG: MBL fold metallo-hydrolase [bacterium]RIK62224.1 MAG: MBL fold metallo-hydrolase [Planctomycetota bacterium]
MRVEIEMLGSGTSAGVPMIGCECWVCRSPNPRNKRLRASVLFRVVKDGSERRILVDVTPDVRLQALRSGFTSVDAVLITHTHADHCHGLDDLRAIYWGGGKKPIDLYGYPESVASLRQTFAYIFDEDYDYKGIARINTHVFEHEPFRVAGLTVTPIPVVHGNMRVAGFRIGDAAYITDTNLVPESSIELLKGVKLLVLDALRRAPHPTHMSLPQALEVARQAGVERVFFTHINHDLEHESINSTLPPFARLGYDMLRASVEEDGSVKVHDIEPSGLPPIVALR